MPLRGSNRSSRLELSTIMAFVHGFVAWLAAHCWGSLFGAKWHDRIKTAGTNKVYLSRGFYRCSVQISVIAGADMIFLLASHNSTEVWPVVLLCLLVGITSGVALGSADY